MNRFREPDVCDSVMSSLERDRERLYIFRIDDETIIVDRIPATYDGTVLLIDISQVTISSPVNLSLSTAFIPNYKR